MTRDDIIKLAIDAGLYSGNPRTPGTEAIIVKRLQRFAELVAAAERKECAKSKSRQQSGQGQRPAQQRAGHESVTGGFEMSEHTKEPCRRCAAFEGLTKAQEAQLSHHREQADKYREAIATLGSEREANELLTTRIAALESNLKLARELLVISETDAERYREIRNWCWYESEAAVVHSPKASVKLGSVCLSHEFLDEFVDQKLARRQEGEQGQKT